MARNLYGCTSADFTITSGGRVIPGAVLTLWTARTGGTQITDLLDVDSVATTTVTSAADGSVVYYGPNNDKTVHWADSGQGSRIAIRPVDITGDPPVLSIGTVTTGAAAANLTGTSESPVLNLTLPSAGANGVDTAAIQSKAVTAAKIADDTITAAQIAANAVGASELADNAVDVAAIDADDLGNGLVLTADSGEPSGMKWSAYGIADLDIGIVDTGTPAAASMTGNPQDGYALNLTLPPVGADGVDTAAIQDDAVTAEKIALIDKDNDNAMIAGGAGNTINRVVSRDTRPMAAHVEGYYAEAQGWYGHAEGAGSIAEGKISHAEGNNTICAANDSHSEGNQTSTGRRQYAAESTGSEDAGDSLGELQYVVIPADEGDVTTYFPNPLTDNVTGRYGAGAQLDAKGNVYASPDVPAVWTGDTLTTVNDLQWAMHSVAMLRSTKEEKPRFVTIAKAVYSGGKTKVYYLGAKPFTTIGYIYGSYAPSPLGTGNGQHSEGYGTNAAGPRAHSEGYRTRAWGTSSHAEGEESRATGHYGSHAEGYKTIASSNAAHAEGGYTAASGIYSHAEGYGTVASGPYSRAGGRESVATRSFQDAFSAGRRAVDGDSQTSRIAYGKSCDNAGWHDIRVMDDVVDGRTYAFESMVVGRQTGGTAGTVGDSFAYKFQGACTVAGGTMTVLGTISRTLIGRTSGMSGDGLSTGVRMSAMTSLYNDDLCLRFDGVADTTFYINVYSTVQELG